MQRALGTLRSKLPSRQQVFPVFSVIVFVVFSWTLYRTFFQVPSWLKYLTLWEILLIVAYILAFALFESLVILGLMLLLSLIFPSRLFKDKFIAQSSTLLLVIGVGAIVLQSNIDTLYHLKIWELMAYPLVFVLALALLIIVLSYLFERFPVILRFVQALADRMTAFAYIYVPLGLIALVLVALRNLW